MDLTQKKKDRFDYLNKLYEEAEGSLKAAFNMEDIGREMKFSYEQTSNIVDYLINEGLIEPYALGGSITLTHYGVKEIEQAYEDPELPTEHFAPVNHIHIHSSGQGNIINTGNSNTFTVNNNFDKITAQERAQEIIKVIENDVSIPINSKAAAIVLLNQFLTEVKNGNTNYTTLNKVLTLGANIAAIGSLIIGLFQLITHQP
jgi:predicted transcriptional regulator